MPDWVGLERRSKEAFFCVNETWEYLGNEKLRQTRRGCGGGWNYQALAWRAGLRQGDRPANAEKTEGNARLSTVKIAIGRDL